jgi:hypothetical protein
MGSSGTADQRHSQYGYEQCFHGAPHVRNKRTQHSTRAILATGLRFFEVYAASQ